MPLYDFPQPAWIDGVLYERGVHDLPKEKAPKWAKPVGQKAASQDAAKKAARSTKGTPKEVSLSEMNRSKGGKSFVDVMSGGAPADE